jgi:hypothetical protein
MRSSSPIRSHPLTSFPFKNRPAICAWNTGFGQGTSTKKEIGEDSAKSELCAVTPRYIPASQRRAHVHVRLSETDLRQWNLGLGMVLVSFELAGSRSFTIFFRKTRPGRARTHFIVHLFPKNHKRVALLLSSLSIIC